MPIYEYECKKCQKVTSILERHIKKPFWSKLFKKPKLRCENCGSKELTRILSTFSVDGRQSMSDSLNEISKMGNVNFVPQQRPMGPPPGGCPYANQHAQSQKEQGKKIDRIKLA